MKKYILLKDLPDCKAGTILTSDDKDCYDYNAIGGEACWYRNCFVERNPEWFEEIEITIDFAGKKYFFTNKEREGIIDELKKKEGICFTHEDLRVAFLCGKMKGTRWSPEKQQWNYVDVFDTFEEYLGSRGQNKH